MSGTDMAQLSRLTWVKIIYMLNDLHFWGITVMVSDTRLPA